METLTHTFTDKNGTTYTIKPDNGTLEVTGRNGLKGLYVLHVSLQPRALRAVFEAVANALECGEPFDRVLYGFGLRPPQSR